MNSANLRSDEEVRLAELLQLRRRVLNFEDWQQIRQVRRLGLLDLSSGKAVKIYGILEVFRHSMDSCIRLQILQGLFEFSWGVLKTFASRLFRSYRCILQNYAVMISLDIL